LIRSIDMMLSQSYMPLQVNAIETAKRAIKKGMSDELISELTELPIEQVEIIRKAIKNN